MQVYERENRNLRDERDSAVMEQRRLSDLLEVARKQYDTVYQNSLEAKSDHETQISSIRGELSLKTFELEQLRLSHSALQTKLQQVGTEADMLRDKNEVLRQQFSQLDTTSAKRIAQLEAALSQAVRAPHFSRKFMY